MGKWIRALGAVLTALLLFGGADAAPAQARPVPRVDLASLGWIWPLEGAAVTRPYVQPAHRYAPGHRGIDLRGQGEVRSPADGMIAFAGPVAGRPVVTIDHGDGLVTTLEPVVTTLRPGEPVARGAPVGTITAGGHSAPGELHFGVRLDGEYINPLLLLGGIPRAVLLPCC